MIELYIKKWNLFFKEWLENPEEKYKTDILIKNHDGRGDKKLLSTYLPQPYLGNPNNCSAVTLNLNPGKKADIREWPNGELVNQLREKPSYFEYAKEFPQLKLKNAKAFWNRQINWINRIGCQEFENFPFAIEICPWHSNKWKDFDWENKEIIEYLNENLFRIIDSAIKNASIKTVLSVGKSYYRLFEMFGFDKIEEITLENSKEKNIEYPKNKKGKLLNRNFSLWKSKTGTKYLNTYVQGSNMPPSKEWNDIQKMLLQIQ